MHLNPLSAHTGRGAGLARFLSCAAALVTLTGCIVPPPPNASVGGTIVNLKVPAPPASMAEADSVLSVWPGHFDYPGLKAVNVSGQIMTPDAGLDLLRRGYASLVLQTPVDPSPIRGSVRIVLADHARLRALAGGLIRLGEGTVDYWAEGQRLDHAATAYAIARSHMFSSVQIVEQNDTIEPSAGGADYLIWFQVRLATANNAGPWIGLWKLKRAGNPAIGQLAFAIGTPEGLPRFQSFLQSVHVVAANPSASASASGSAGAGGVVKSGSGIVIDATGHIMTNNHVIDGCQALRVIDTAGTMTPASVVAADSVNDLALLKTDRRWPTWAAFRDSQGLRPGEPLVVAGFPLVGLVSPEMAVATGSLTALAGIRGDSRQFQLSAPVQPGNSGGPVIDDSGRVVGVATSVLNGLAVATATGGAMPQNVNFAIKTSTAREFADTHDVRLDTASAGHGMSAAEVGDIARKFTVKVECPR
jgi:hypothetical protein